MIEELTSTNDDNDKLRPFGGARRLWWDMRCDDDGINRKIIVNNSITFPFLKIFIKGVV